MGGKGGGGSTTTVQKADPWKGQQPYLTTAFSAAGSLFDPWLQKDKKGNVTGLTNAGNALAPDYYPGQTVADQSAWTKQALQMQANAAKNMSSNPLIKAANSAVRNIATGNALEDNTGLARLEKLSKSSPITRAQALGGTGLSTLSGLAQQGTGAGNAGLSALNAYAGTDFNAGNSALYNLQGTTGAGINAGNAALSNLGGYTGTGINAGNAGLSTLNTLAAEDNPYIDSLYQRANNQAQASLDSNFNRAGRYGSGAHEAAAADAANNLADQMYSNLYTQRAQTAANAANAYQSGINAGINAQQAAGNLYNAGMGQGINAQQAAGNLYNAGQQLGVNAAQDAASAYNAALGQRISAAQGAGNLYNTGTSNYLNAYGQQADAASQAGSLYNTGIGQQAAAASMGQQLAQQPYTDAAMLSEAGGVKDDYNQQLINAAIDRYNYGANQPLSALSTYNNLIQGSYGGTTSTTGQQSGGSTLGNVLGGGLTGAGIGAGIASLGGASGLAALSSPWALGGAAIGGLLGLF